MVQLEKKLSGLRVLVTRPEAQARQLSEQIEAAGGQAVVFPAIEIKPIDKKYWEISELADTDILIFISRNAVTQFVPAMCHSIPETVLLASVGRGTTETMQQFGLRVDYQPEFSTGSEGLLALPDFADMTGKKVVIVRGKGGREHLAGTLKQRGAQVRYIEVYERVLPSPTEKQIQQAISADCIICTSVASVMNLCILLHSHLKIFYDKPMLVCSQRIKKQAELSGFQTVDVSKESSDDSIIAQLIKMENQ